MCKSDCAPMWFRPFPEKIVRERLDGAIRTLRGEIAGYSLRDEVVAAFCFGFSFWLHQWGIPYRSCRFYLLLAGAVGKRQGISIPYPSPTPLLTPLGIRCGGAYLLPRAYRDIVSLCPVLSLLPSSEYGLAVCVRLCIVRVSVGVLGLERSFFIIGG